MDCSATLRGSVKTIPAQFQSHNRFIFPLSLPFPRYCCHPPSKPAHFAPTARLLPSLLLWSVAPNGFTAGTSFPRPSQ